MAVKSSWSAGDVLTAADLTDTFAAKANYPAGGSNGQALTKSGTSTAWATISPHGNSGEATVATSQTTTSTSYTDLATAGPAVTVTTGTKALVTITCSMNNSTSNEAQVVSFAVSGATSVSAGDGWRLLFIGAATTDRARMSVTYLITGLTAGSNTFTMKYRVSGGTGTFSERSITVIDMGS